MSITIHWTQQPPMPIDKAGSAAALIGTDLVLAGGVRWGDGVKVYLNRTDVYDTRAKHWRAGPVLPVGMGYGASATVNGRLLAIGGSDGKRIIRDCWRLDPSSGWQADGQFPNDCLNLSRAVSVGDAVILFAGGRNPDANNQHGAGDGAFLRGAQPGSRWEEVASYPDGPTCLVSCAAIGGAVYAFGGSYQNAAGNFVNRATAHRFDPAIRRFTKLRPMPEASRGITAVAVNDRFIVLLGGYNATESHEGKPLGYGYSAAALIYDTREDRYSTGTPMPFPVVGMEAGIVDGAIYGAGGEPHQQRARTDRTLCGQIVI